ncbi:hypothetical protein G6F56_012694 [Rhizopus delemar]|nr:hypothetical protein G6F56_012694 [Rhizopus delemar]
MGDNDFMAPVRQAVYPPLTPVQSTIRGKNQQSRENSAPLTADIYFHLTEKVDDLTKLNREQEKELYDVRQRDAIRRLNKSLPEANQYDVEQTLGSRRNARVMEGLERYVLSHVEFGQTDSRDLAAFLNGQFYNIRASVRKAAKRGIDVTANTIEKRARTTATRRRDKIRGRKSIYELLKGSTEMSLFPFAEHFIDDRYSSEKEDYYSPETYAAASAECCHLSPDGEVDENTVYAAVIRRPVEDCTLYF